MGTAHPALRQVTPHHWDESPCSRTARPVPLGHWGHLVRTPVLGLGRAAALQARCVGLRLDSVLLISFFFFPSSPLHQN